MSRFFGAVLLAIVVTLGCLYFMSQLAKSPAPPPDAASQTSPDLTPVSLPPPERAKPPQDPKPEPQPKATKMPAVESVQPTAPATTQAPPSGTGPVVGQFNPMGGKLEMTAPGGMGGQGQEATPLVRMDPRYPIEAARDGKEGWVKLRFTVTAAGTVDQVQVLDAEPKRLFDKAAVDALRKWRYQPKVVDGKAIAQPDQEVVLAFKLDKKA
ncbi:energy transducer TonB [Gallaecimonas kandeliae]|uniref:energy transducer TonB n=1 Tax=Gallaecimonas kandeliae TaxID=3029055 RepID=UPI002647AA24|nr:energy transducer TonB [Gallaecimonas kandeliae]WKE66006.1 energy transducer TonB [Gallaecimonas kandeliae]